MNIGYLTYEQITERKILLRACLYERRDGTFTGTGRLSSRIYMNFLQAGQ